jgi:hypothetical protein
MKPDRQYKDSALFVGLGLIGVLIIMICITFLS